jgi:hypothetical protein
VRRSVRFSGLALGAALAATAADFPIVFTQLSPDPARPACRVVILEPGGRLRVLTGGFAAARDPHVSFDGKRILFSGKRAASDSWQVFEMEADGSQARQITRLPMDCRSPIYQSSLYVLSSDQPWHQIAFAGAAPGSSPSLYSARLDGSDVRRLTYNPYGDADPVLMEDGRMLYAAFRESGSSLFGINLDGTDVARYAADQGALFRRTPCVTAGRLVVFVESGTASADGGGSLGAVSLRRPFHSYRALTRPEDGLYHSPSPLPTGEILVSRRPVSGSGTYAIYRFDPATGRAEAVFDDPRWHDIQAQVLASRPEPDGRSSVVDPKQPTGILYCLNAYLSDLPQRVWLAPGSARRLRVIEGVPETSAGGRRPLAMRILGEVPVEEDGSFNIRVPANIPIQLQLVDEDGLALRSCRWIWVRNREYRGCIGCHEDPELVPENRLAAALTHPSMNLTLPPERRRLISFGRDVAPLLTARCAGEVCHRRIEEFQALITDSARTSPLVWRLYGRKTGRPWDTVSADGALAPMPPPGAAPLTEDERRTILEWIDLGAQP